MKGYRAAVGGGVGGGGASGYAAPRGNVSPSLTGLGFAGFGHHSVSGSVETGSAKSGFRRRATVKGRPSKGDRQRATVKGRPSKGDRQRATVEGRPSKGDQGWGINVYF